MMANPMGRYKSELIDWIKTLDDLELLKALIQLRNQMENSKEIQEADAMLENNDNQQLAARIASEGGIGSIEVPDASFTSQEPSVLSDVEAKYVVKYDFDERFAQGLNMLESKKRMRAFISSLPWKE